MGKAAGEPPQYLLTVIEDVTERKEASPHAAVSDDQLVLYYQPQAKIAGQIIGFEALVRWQHPIRGLVSPDVFIPLAEERLDLCDRALGSARGLS
jgi:EAL domain-containing protein (putative c-di-GMP-specific phosphodiesterase class I)